MGYESRVFVVNVTRGDRYDFAEKVAEVDMSKMGYNNGWRELFTREIDYKLFMDDGNTEFDEDKYGEHLKAAPVERVLEWLKEYMKKDKYRRLPLLYGLLKGIKEKQWDEIEVVHYGY